MALNRQHGWILILVGAGILLIALPFVTTDIFQTRYGSSIMAVLQGELVFDPGEVKCAGDICITLRERRAVPYGLPFAIGVVVAFVGIAVVISKSDRGK